MIIIIIVVVIIITIVIIIYYLPLSVGRVWLKLILFEVSSYYLINS